MKKLRRTQLVGILFALAAVFYFAFTFAIEVRPNLSEPGPRVFPFFAEAIIFVCALIMIFGKEKTSGEGATDESKPWMTKDGWKRLLIVMGEMVVYAALLQVTGFIISSLVMMMVLIYTLHGDRKVNPVAAVIIDLVLTLGVYFLFTRAFGILLPSGLLFR